MIARSRVPAWVAVCFALTLVAARFQVGEGGAELETNSPFGLGVGWWVGAMLVVLSAIPRRVEVGAEGLTIGWLFAPRFVRYSHVVRAAPVGATDLFLELTNGETLRIQHALREGTPRSVLTRLWQTLSAGAEGPARPHERIALARGRRTTEEWAAALALLARPGSQYRSALTHERLWELACHPALDSDLRGAAAVALADGLDGDARAKLKELARRSIVPSLRRAFALVASASNADDLRRALELADSAE